MFVVVGMCGQGCVWAKTYVVGMCGQGWWLECVGKDMCGWNV